MGDRKARLAALAARAGRSKPATEAEDSMDISKNSENAEKSVTSSSEANNKRGISFRNYAPKDESLDQTNDDDDDDTSPPKRSKTLASSTPASMEEKSGTSSALEEALREAQQEIEHPDAKYSNETISDIAPKKLNWDLKRDIQDKIGKLERRTQKAIVELLKERLEKEASEQANSDSDLD